MENQAKTTETPQTTQEATTTVTETPQEPEIVRAEEKGGTTYPEKLNKRILFKGEFATVRYAGDLVHPLKEGSKVNPKDLWLGIEWDNLQKGKKSKNSKISLKLEFETFLINRTSLISS